MYSVFSFDARSKLEPISPGSIHGNRVKCVKNQIFVASADKVFQITTNIPESSNKQRVVLQNATVEQIRTQLKHEIMEISFDRNRVGIVDSLGNIEIFSVFHDQEEQKRRRISYTLTPTPNEYGESGWAGFQFHPEQHAKCASARFFYKDAFLFNEEKVERTFHLSQHPTKIKYIQFPGLREPILAIAEYNEVALWDLRSQQCIGRLTPTRGCIFTISSKKNYIAMAGTDRSVFMYDYKKLVPREKWQNCLKYEISFLDFKDDICYVGGFSNSELRCGNETKSYKVHADTRWIGLDKDEITENIGGVSASGMVYIIHKPFAVV